MSSISLKPADYPPETQPPPRAKPKDWLEKSKDPEARLFRVNRALQVSGLSSDDYHWTTDFLYKNILELNIGTEGKVNCLYCGRGRDEKAGDASCVGAESHSPDECGDGTGGSA